MTAGHVVAIVGSTASGKSALALDLALHCRGEVVNTDAMQLYRGMDIGTAKATLEERARVPHHLVDVLEVTEPASVAQFQAWARTALAEIWGRDRLPVLVGGSALYTRAVIDRFEFPGTDPDVRAGLEQELAEVGPAVLHERLRRLDPAAAEAIEASNTRRVVRALEVLAITGRPYSARLPPMEYQEQGTVQIGLDVPREVLDARIEARVDHMWEQGLVDEVRLLVARGLRQGRTASRALGYQQVLAFLAGECTQDEARAATVAATRRFARRQESWFRRDPRVRWLPHDHPHLLAAAADLVGCLPSSL
jgi:tRNA dimethylallyltransferase